MRQRSLTNSRKCENLKLRQSYARAHQACELGYWFPSQFDRFAATETHHLFGGTSGRHDLVSNIMRLSAPAHRWCEQYKTDGRIVCLMAKQLKGELNPEEIKEAAGMFLAGWLAKSEATFPWSRTMLEQLRKAFP